VPNLDLAQSPKTSTPKRICNCGKPVVARGLCSRHYKQWQTHGGDASRVKADIASDPLSYVTERLVRDESTGCLVYTGEKNRHGYGRVRVRGKTVLVHRFLWITFRGPIDGLDLDHLCRNPPCAELSHLEPVTHQENCRRGLRGELYRRA
jgi:hypothetical protein